MSYFLSRTYFHFHFKIEMLFVSVCRYRGVSLLNLASIQLKIFYGLHNFFYIYKSLVRPFEARKCRIPYMNMVLSTKTSQITNVLVQLGVRKHATVDN